VRKSAFAIALLAVFATTQPGFAQIGRLWSFEERRAESDLVVVATRGTTREIGKTTLLSDFPVIEVSTVFRVVLTLKGDAVDTLRLRHYRWDRERLPRGSGVVNGPHELSFSPSGGQSPDYLLFLKKDADGSFSPVSGHTFPGEGVFSLRQPL
jgi:hypothetical protein